MTAEERFQTIANYSWTNPDIVKFWLGPKLTLLISNPEKMHKTLSSPKCLEKWNIFYKLMERDHGLISGSCKAKWKEHRKLFNSSFSIKMLESFVPTFIEFSEILCEKLHTKVESDEFDFFAFSKRISFDILCTTSLGMKMKGSEKKSNYEEVFEAYETTEAAMNKKFTMPFLYPHTIYKLTQLYREERKAQKVLDEFQRDAMTERRNYLEMKRQDGESQNERNIVIDNIIMNEEKFTTDEIRDHILTFVSAYETWGNALAHAILLLAMHPNEQEKLHEEIKNIDDLSDSPRINELSYLDMTLKEIFRYMPTVPMVLRETLDDYEIKPGCVIPQGVSLIFNFYALHRNKSIWGNDSHDFKPERFSEENSKNRESFSYLPFSSGPRICIGHKYSIISLKIFLIKLIQTFTFSTTMKPHDIQLKSYISLKLCSKHLISIKKRH